MTSYRELGEQLAAVGIGSFFRSPDQMVISNQNPAWPDSNTFWVSLKGENRYLVTWLPAVYFVPATMDIGQVCEAVFHSATTAIYSVAPELVERFQLRELSNGEMEQAGLV